MRLWSLHPSYLDSKGLVALWREGLLAQKVLVGETKGYKNHPQLMRFKAVSNPVGTIASYLRCVADEADSRAYNFDRSKIVNQRTKNRLLVTDGQLEYEWLHLLGKLATRDPDLYHRVLIARQAKGRQTIARQTGKIRLHPLFTETPGPVADWERTQAPGSDDT